MKQPTDTTRRDLLFALGGGMLLAPIASNAAFLGSRMTGSTLGGGRPAGLIDVTVTGNRGQLRACIRRLTQA